MPIIDVEIVGRAPLDGEHQLAQRLATRAAAILTPGREGACWVRLRQLKRACYAEDGGSPPSGAEPVFVTLLLASPPEGPERQAQAEALTAAMAEAIGRPPDKVHLLYALPAAGRIAFGGRLVPASAGSSAVLHQETP